MSTDLKTCYAWHRRMRLLVGQRPAYATAAQALELARADVASGLDRYPQQFRGWLTGAAYTAYGTAPHGQMLRFIENPAECGLRFVGYADEIARGIGHRGWYSDTDQNEKVRGVVYQMAARNGWPRYIPGCADGNIGGAASLSFMPEDIETGEQGGDNGGLTSDQAKRDAANCADHIAEHVAEKERDYQSAWQAGSYFYDIGERASAIRKTVREMLAELRIANLPERLCAFLRTSLQGKLAELEELRQTRAKLRSGEGLCTGGFDFYWSRTPDHEAAFKDGAQL